MAARRRPALTRRKAKRAETPAAPRPLVYTAQDVARFCEVDLKTIHHWADGGKIAHHRTTGRHLRFRHNHVLAFLRHHGYPLHAELSSARPTVFLALGGDLPIDETARKLESPYFVRRFSCALEAIAHLVAGEPEALVLSASDPTWGGPVALRALKDSASTAWHAIVVVTAPGDDAAATTMRDAGADVVLAATDLARLRSELDRLLGID